MQQIPLVDLRAQFRTIQPEIRAAIDGVLESMDLLLGPNVRAFEDEFAAFCRARYAIGLNSGTDALALALRACGVRPGDEVITASNSFIATAGAIIQSGGVPVFVDVDAGTYTLDPALLERAITPRTRAVVPVHLFGQMADLPRIVEVARRHGLAVVEDACQAHGAELAGQRAGSVGDAAAFSFYMSKNLGAYGDAGAVTTNSLAIATELRRLRDHGAARKYEHAEFGINSRLDELQAAILRVKLRYLEEWNEQRIVAAARYDAVLGDLDVVVPEVRPGARHVYHLYVIQTDERERLRESLDARGVATGIHYPIPIHQQPACQGVGRVVGRLEHTERLANRILSLPIYPELEERQIGYVADCLRACLRSGVRG
jgi:dTDP-4-amino-4,6-dideoxygalactose transaminase